MNATRDLDRFLAPRIAILKTHHRHGVGAEDIHRAGTALLVHVGGGQAAAQSFQLAALHTMLADILLAGASQMESAKLAQMHARAARAGLEGVSTLSADVTRLSVHAALIDAVSSKSMGDIDGAFNTLEEAARVNRQEFGASSLDLVPLVRQEVLLRQTKSAFAELANGAAAYAKLRPVEYYATIKRVFEFLLNEQLLADAKHLFPVFRRSYSITQHRLPPIARVSFVKNAAHFHLLSGDRQFAQELLRRALVVAEELGLSGQQRQIVALMSERRLGQRALRTFAIQTL